MFMSQRLDSSRCGRCVLLACAPCAHAQWAVVDVGAIAQLIQQVATMEQQLSTAKDQLTQARDQLDSMTRRARHGKSPVGHQSELSAGQLESA